MFSSLPDDETLYQALINRDSSYEGLFFAGVKTTGIFCRTTCTARKPKRENVEFFPTAHEALERGFRPCKLCHPMAPLGQVPEWAAPLLAEVETHPDLRLTDQNIRQRGVDPSRLRRWFLRHHGMTFQTYLRTLRIGQAFGRIRYGDKVIEAAFASGYGSLSGFTASFKKEAGFAPVKSRQSQLIVITRILTPLGPMLVGGVDQGICLLDFIDRRMMETQLKRLKKVLRAELVPGAHPLFKQMEQQLQEYFAGERREFDVPLRLSGSSFQEKVWSGLMGIPYGSTRSYRQQAEALGMPKAVRAVARANGANSLAIIIPCHRVIGHNGELVGYGGGLWRKKYLLEHELKHKV
jgi:AraC family transcriptional regulator, regulatory protein of adaptative response / methylated-DNA-[protein]-cysteine methyltransferase